MSAVHCCAHSEQLNVSCSRPGVPVRATSYSHIARPQLGHAGVLPTGCSDDLNKLDWGIASLLVLPTNPPQRNLFPPQRVPCPLGVKSRHVQCKTTSALGQSRHSHRKTACPLSANSGHRAYSITSSAAFSKPCGTLMPSALAVLRFMTKSNFVGCKIGRSPGFSPLRIRAT